MSPCLVTGRVVPEPADLLRELVPSRWPACLWLRPWPGGSVQHRRLGGVPFLLDLAEVPDGQGNDPGEHEHAYDHEAGLIDVEGAHECPEPAAEMVLLLNEAEDF